MEIVDTQAADRIVREHARGWRPGTFLAWLDPADLRTLLTGGELVSFERGRPLVREGEPPGSVFLLLSAVVKVTTTARPGGSDAGPSTLVAIRGSGDVVGELSMLDNGPRSATVTATPKGCLTVRLTAESFQERTRSRPGIRDALLSAVSAKLRDATQRGSEVTTLPPIARLARVLITLNDRYGQTHEARGGRVHVLNLTLNQQELGALAAVSSRATMSRLLRELRDGGIVRTRNREIVIVDMPRLDALGRG
ncbi:Crp/Fnr family transcriptional regulator [Actinomadura sp. GTD37]|uniref:Crp/Fnr family transcriptional regulator n=1 Tax=Actinomadura sp. GTD37 TaxID=1778030 RepID=UPI0035C014C4